MKQVIIVRRDLQMSPGKMAAQACHASLIAYDDARKNSTTSREWMRTGQTKIVLGCDSQADLEAYARAAHMANLSYSLIGDAGRTELPPGTLTAVGIGPAKDEDVDKITGSLTLY